jgi:hypothetical protein
MLPHAVFTCALAVLFAGSLNAAPALLDDPSRQGPAEVVFSASARQAVTALYFLRSDRFLDAVLASPQVKDLPCFARVEDRRRWLIGRLEIKTNKPLSRITVRMIDCRLRHGLVVLDAVVDQVARKPDNPRRRGSSQNDIDAERRLIAAMRRRLNLVPNAQRARRIDSIEQAVDASELQVNPLKVVQPPRRAR